MILRHYRIAWPVTLCLLIMVVLCGCASRINLSDDLQLLLKDLERKSYLVGQFRAEFTKVRKSPLFRDEMKVKGVLLFQKENRFQLQLSGDINVEILSDGEFLTIIHDGRDREFYHFRGDRDRSRFSDPLMVIVQSITGGQTDRFMRVSKTGSDDHLSLDIQPGNTPEFERMNDVYVEFSESGMINKVVIDFSDGSRDTTVFSSWSMLTQDAPAIVKMNERLESLSKAAPLEILPGSSRIESPPQANGDDSDPIKNHKKPILDNPVKENDGGLRPYSIE